MLILVREKNWTESGPHDPEIRLFKRDGEGWGRRPFEVEQEPYHRREGTSDGSPTQMKQGTDRGIVDYIVVRVSSM